MQIISVSANDTLALGKKISKLLCKGDIICLFGPLGSGKTVLTKGIAVGLGISRDSVISPTFVLIRQYRGRLSLSHFDLYRIKTQREILALGYEDYLYDEAVSVIEWADRLGCLLPKERLDIRLSAQDSKKRLLKMSAYGSRYRELLEKIDEDIGH